jgi:elongation factor P
MITMVSKPIANNSQGDTQVLKVNQLKKGYVININGLPYQVRHIDISTPTARGTNTIYRVKYTGVTNGQNLDQTYKGTDTLEEMSLDRRAVTYLYSDQENCHFMDAENYEQYSLHVDQLADQREWLADNMTGIMALMLDGQILAIELPTTVDLEIVETAPVIKGATATNRNKPATLSNGHVVLVPEYMPPGEWVRVNTETGKFMARTK